MSKFDKLYNLIMENTEATNNTDEIVKEMQDLDWDYKSDEEKLKTQVFYQIVGDLRELIVSLMRAYVFIIIVIAILAYMQKLPPNILKWFYR